MSILDRIIHFCMSNKLVVFLAVASLFLWGIIVAPFDWELKSLPRHPVPVDAIPDIGENQQIVFTKWIGRSPQDVEDQITYPLTAGLLSSENIVQFMDIFGITSDTVFTYFLLNVSLC